jgi:hypothetical protein
MTPKEKAEQLVDRFMAIKSMKLSDYSLIYYPFAKQCALIAVDFALSQLDVKISPPRLDIQVELNKQNLNKLKQEIEKL